MDASMTGASIREKVKMIHHACCAVTMRPPR